MVPKHIRVLLPHNTQTDHDVEEIGGSVIGNIYIGVGKNNFPTPPVDQATLQTGLTDFSAAIAATVQGGPLSTNAKNKKKHELVALLRKLGLYVQANCNEDVAILTSSGFQAAATTRIRGPLPKAAISAVQNGHTTQLLVTLDKMPKAAAVELYSAPVANGAVVGDWKLVGTFTSARRMPVNGLTPGTIYAFKARGVGGTTGYGDFSDPVTHMSL
jgi:hypothetical protein